MSLLVIVNKAQIYPVNTQCGTHHTPTHIDVTSAFPWVVTYDIRAILVPRVGLKTLPYKVGPNEDVRDLSGGDCDAPI